VKKELDKMRKSDYMFSQRFLIKEQDYENTTYDRTKNRSYHRLDDAGAVELFLEFSIDQSA
jgi:hypothetical protein